jgi:hypothetical protein
MCNIVSNVITTDLKLHFTDLLLNMDLGFYVPRPPGSTSTTTTGTPSVSETAASLLSPKSDKPSRSTDTDVPKKSSKLHGRFLYFLQCF